MQRRVSSDILCLCNATNVFASATPNDIKRSFGCSTLVGASRQQHSSDVGMARMQWRQSAAISCIDIGLVLQQHLDHGRLSRECGIVQRCGAISRSAPIIVM